MVYMGSQFYMGSQCKMWYKLSRYDHSQNTGKSRENSSTLPFHSMFMKLSFGKLESSPPTEEFSLWRSCFSQVHQSTFSFFNPRLQSLGTSVQFCNVPRTQASSQFKPRVWVSSCHKDKQAVTLNPNLGTTGHAGPNPNGPLMCEF